jgi:hypothetical protein
MTAYQGHVDQAEHNWSNANNSLVNGSQRPRRPASLSYKTNVFDIKIVNTAYKLAVNQDRKTCSSIVTLEAPVTRNLFT